MTANDMQNRQDLTDRLSAAAKGYASNPCEETGKRYQRAIKDALRAGMPVSILDATREAATASTRPVSLR